MMAVFLMPLVLMLMLTLLSANGAHLSTSSDPAFIAHSLPASSSTQRRVMAHHRRRPSLLRMQEVKERAPSSKESDKGKQQQQQQQLADALPSQLTFATEQQQVERQLPRLPPYWDMVRVGLATPENDKRTRIEEKYRIESGEEGVRRQWQRKRQSIMELVGETGSGVLDTVEDVSLHWRRQFMKLNKVNLMQKRLDTDKPRLVILGSGWAAHAMIKIIDTDKFDVVIVSPRNYFLFTPMLAASAVGTVEYRSITEPMRKANPLTSYYEGEAIDIDPEKKEIRVRSKIQTTEGETVEFAVPYDTLIFSPGVKSSSFGIKGVYEHCYFLKEIEDARKLRTAVQDRFERANIPDTSDEEKQRLLTFAVCGGGPTGVEFCGELFDLLRSEFRKFYPKLTPMAKVVLVQSGPNILPIFDESLRSVGLQKLRDQGVQVALETRVQEVGPKSILLSNGTELPYGLAVWAAGTGPREITKRLIEKVPTQQEMASQSKKLAVDPWLRVYDTNGTILAMGDCTKMDPPLPQTAQVAAQQGAFLARLLNRGYNMSKADGRPPTYSYKESEKKGFGERLFSILRIRGKKKADPFNFFNYGMLAYLGDQKALAQIQANDLDFIKASGQAGFYLWRSVYVVKQVSFRNRVLVLFDWFKSRIFGRDLTRL